MPRITLPAIVANLRSLVDLHCNPARFLPPSVRSKIVEVWSDGDTGHGWDGYVARYEIAGPIGDRDRMAALEFLDDALQPAGEDFVLGELARLRAMTASRDVGQDLTLVFAAYADEMQRYPADVVREVLRGWRGKFWPTWAELVERLDRLVKPRHALRSAIERGYQPSEAEAPREPLTAEDLREIDDLLARHGIRFDERGRVRSIEQSPMTRNDRERMASELAEFRARWNANVLAGQEAAALRAARVALGIEHPDKQEAAE